MMAPMRMELHGTRITRCYAQRPANVIAMLQRSVAGNSPGNCRTILCVPWSHVAVIRGGFKVYPAEVENVLTAIEGVIEAAVVGRPDELLTESVVAFLNAAPGLDEARVRAFCAERLADYKVPARVVIGPEPLPRNANGKIQKAELRGMARALPAARQPAK